MEIDERSAQSRKNKKWRRGMEKRFGGGKSGFHKTQWHGGSDRLASKVHEDLDCIREMLDLDIEDD